jgi:hypothetical protein
VNITLVNLWTIYKVGLLVVGVVARLLLRRAIKRSPDPEFFGIVYQDLTRWSPKQPRRP